MRPLVLFALLPAVAWAAPALQIVRAAVSQMDGGIPDAPGFEHVGGEMLFFSCRVAGYSKSQDEKVHLRYSLQAFDPKGVPLDEVVKNEITEEVSPQDRDWLPKISTEVALPPLAPPGEYKITVKAEDVLAKTTAELTVPFHVRGHRVEPSDVLIVRNFQFYRDEDGKQSAIGAAYKPGDAVWARFDIIGFKYGPDNKVDVSYVTSILAPGGKLLWTQPEPATERSESFYPKLYVPASMGITLQPNIRPGEYTLAVSVKDAVGGQSYDATYNFTIQ